MRGRNGPPSLARVEAPAPSSNGSGDPVGRLLLAEPRPPRGFNGIAARLIEAGDTASQRQRYAYALVLSLGSSLVALLLALAGAHVSVLILPVLAIVLATFIGGLRAGLLASVVAIVLAEAIVLEPRFSIEMDRDEATGLLALAGAALIGGLLSEALRQSRSRALELAEQRQQLLRAVLESEKQVQNVADAMPVLVARSTADGYVDYYNRALLDYTGKTREELEGDGWLSIVHPDDAREALDRWQARVATGEGEVFEQRLRRHDGAYRWHLVFGEPVRDAEGRISYWIGANVDIHDRKLAEDRVARSEDRYRMLADSMEAMICMSSRDNGVLDFFNKRFFAYTGLSPDAMPDVPMREVIHPEDFPDAVRIWLEGRETGKPFEGEHRYRRHDGEYRWHLARASHVADPDGGRGVWLLTIVDIDDQKRIEDALRLSETRYRTLVDAAPVFVYNADADGNVTFVSESFYAYTGLRADEVKDAVTAIAGALHRDDVASVTEAWAQAQRLGDSFEMEARVRGADGVYRWFLTRLVPARDANGAVASWVGTSTNIDDRKRIEDALRESREQYRELSESLREANAAKDEFLGLVSHELKTPITTILGNAEVLYRRGAQLDAAARAGALEDIQHDAARLHQIIENLLILARLERGRAIEMEPLLLRHVVEKLAEEHRHRFPQRNIVLHIDRDVQPVLAAQVYLEQVLRNLLSNAEKYSPTHMPIEVRLSCDPGRCIVEVVDSGAGIPEEERGFIFEPFWRSRTARHVAGVGIGLAVCKRLVEAQAGEIAYAPREEGGSVFRVAIPCYDEGPVEA